MEGTQKGKKIVKLSLIFRRTAKKIDIKDGHFYHGEKEKNL